MRNSTRNFERQAVARPLLLLLIAAGYAVVYGTWRVAFQGDSNDGLLADAFVGAAVSGAVAVGCWCAVRRCGDNGRVRFAWTLIAIGLTSMALGFVVNAWYQATKGPVPYPSAADIGYLGFYPMMLVGLLSFPRERLGRAERVRLALDTTIVLLSGVGAVWYLVLGPTVTAGGQSAWGEFVSGAYPVGSILLIFAASYALARVRLPELRLPIRVLVAGIGVNIVGDTLNGWFALHPSSALGDLATGLGGAFVDVFWTLALVTFGLAAWSQRSVQAQPEAHAESPITPSTFQPGRWLPYGAPVLFFSLLAYAQSAPDAGPRVVLTIAAIVVVILVLVRQGLAQKDAVAAQGELRYLALHDGLTGLPNRTLILDRVEHALRRARREGTPIAVMFLDLDGFKAVNDTFGHAMGDDLLRGVSARLTGILRESDTVGRLGGDEFVVLVEGDTLVLGPDMVAERIHEVLRPQFVLDEVEDVAVHVGASIGIAMGLPAKADELLRDADLALYQAKAAGKDRHVLFAPQMRNAIDARVELETDLRNALGSDEFTLMYQPTFDLQNGRITGVEALVRWEHPTQGLLLPDEFIPLAEKTGLILPLGSWILKEACQQAAEWGRRAQPLNVSVNVSARQLASDERFRNEVEESLVESGLPPASLILEISERDLMPDASTSAKRLFALKELGVQIAIDDFGTGFSSVGFLQKFPVDAVKIDRSFVTGITSNPESPAIVHALVELGRALGVQTLGQGVENPAQLRRLQDEQLTTAQGYLFARPLTPSALEELLCQSSDSQVDFAAAWRHVADR